MMHQIYYVKSHKLLAHQVSWRRGALIGPQPFWFQSSCSIPGKFRNQTKPRKRQVTKELADFFLCMTQQGCERRWQIKGRTMFQFSCPKWTSTIFQGPKESLVHAANFKKKQNQLTCCCFFCKISTKSSKKRAPSARLQGPSWVLKVDVAFFGEGTWSWPEGNHFPHGVFGARRRLHWANPQGTRTRCRPTCQEIYGKFSCLPTDQMRELQGIPTWSGSREKEVPTCKIGLLLFWAHGFSSCHGFLVGKFFFV